jgi:hypothetical protein
LDSQYLLIFEPIRQTKKFPWIPATMNQLPHSFAQIRSGETKVIAATFSDGNWQPRPRGPEIPDTLSSSPLPRSHKRKTFIAWKSMTQAEFITMMIVDRKERAESEKGSSHSKSMHATNQLAFSSTHAHIFIQRRSPKAVSSTHRWIRNAQAKIQKTTHARRYFLAFV